MFVVVPVVNSEVDLFGIERGDNRSSGGTTTSSSTSFNNEVRARALLVFHQRD